MTLADALIWASLIPVAGGAVYALLSTAAVLLYFARARSAAPTDPAFTPPLTVLKPCYGLERDLEARLRTACEQDYPDYQVVFSVQRPDDPALPVLHRLLADYGQDRVAVVVHDVAVGPNGKVNNLLGALPAARHDILVISDSDALLRPDYLRAMAAPFADPRVGGVHSLFRATDARRWWERLELLMLNADFLPSVLFADVTGASDFGLGPSIAVRHDVLQAIGGLEALVDYLAEDYEIGHRVAASGRIMALVPHVVDVAVDIPSPGKWWTHQVYWDQNTRAARPVGFFATVLIKAVPFALLFAALRLFDPVGVAVLAGTVGLRLLTGWLTLRFGFRDAEGVRNLALLPLRDLVGLATWVMAFGQRSTEWRGTRYVLQGDGRMVAVGPRP